MLKITFGLIALSASDASPPPGDTPRLRINAQEKVTLKDDFEKENSRWRIVSGSWVRKSGVLSQTATENAFNLVLLEDSKFSDIG